ncbi:MAG: hypothetical protein MJ114_07145 [Acetatifactor sp.]|nr:hypothetical protein [Acetatifactor sp.]
MKHKTLQKLLAACLAVTLSVSLAACGNETKVTPSSSTVTESTSESSIASTVESASEEVTPEKVKASFSDFYLESDPGWVSDYALEEGDLHNSYTRDTSVTLNERLASMLTDASPEDYPDDPGMQKMILFYNQLLEEGADRQASMTSMREMMDTIESQKTIGKLITNVLEDDTLSVFNNLMKYFYIRTDQEFYGTQFAPKMFFDMYISFSEEELDAMKRQLGKVLLDLGYTDAEAERMAGNAVAVNTAVRELYLNTSHYAENYWDGNEEGQKLTFPFHDIVRKLNLGIQDLTPYHEEYYLTFFATPEYIDFIQDLFVPENLQMIKDYLAVCVVDNLYILGDVNVQADYVDFQQYMAGAEPMTDREEFYGNDLDYWAAAVLAQLDYGTLSHYYKETYISDGMLQDMETMAFDLRTQLQKILRGSEWANIKAREKLALKVKTIPVMLGAYDTYNDLDTLVIGKSAFDTAASLMRSNLDYDKYMGYGDGFKRQNEANLNVVNAHYISHGNTITICDGLFLMMDELGDASYEEKLGAVGSIIAHEFCHALDENNVYYDSHENVIEAFGDEDWAGFSKYYDQIYNFFTNKTTAHGHSINAPQILSETFCDLLAINTCLQLLETRENPDYEAFFHSFSMLYRSVETEGYERIMFKIDNHLPNHERVNFSLGMFDRFYEVFDIDENSPYFVPADQRIKIYQ